jgi:hypothetical protein
MIKEMMVVPLLLLCCWVPNSPTDLAQFVIAKIKTQYLRAVFRQEVAWLDQQSSATLSSRIAANIPKIRSAYDERVCPLP